MDLNINVSNNPIQIEDGNFKTSWVKDLNVIQITWNTYDKLKRKWDAKHVYGEWLLKLKYS